MDTRNQFLSTFDWTNFTLDYDTKPVVGALIVEFHDFFVQHRFDLGLIVELRVQLKPLEEEPDYNPKLSAPINPKHRFLVELTRKNR